MSPAETGASSLSALLAAYVPMDRLHGLASGHELPARSHGSILFADISGFTPLTEKLERELGPRRGGEELTRHLNEVYRALIDEIHDFRGAVVGFSGDAITCWFDGDDGLRATTCASFLQQTVTELAPSFTSKGVPPFSIKVSVTNGDVRRLLVGDPAVQLLDVLTGDIVDRMASAESVAAPGEVVVSAEIARAAGARITVSEWRTSSTAERFAVVGEVREPHGKSPWPPLDLRSLGPEKLRPWLLPTVYDRLQSGHGDFLAELRKAAAVFVSFGGLDFEDDGAIEEKLDAYVRWTQTVLAHYEGSLIQLTTGDKGSYIYAAFGAPTAHEDVVKRALSAALALSTPPDTLAYIKGLQIGIGCGRMRAGAYGSSARRTYGVLGDETNVAARLMGKAEPGQILVSQRIAEEGGLSHSFEALGSVSIKGKGRLPLFELRGRGDSSMNLKVLHTKRTGTPMVGRSRERAAVRQVVDAFRRGLGATLVIVEGEPGMGKSRVVAELVEHAGAGASGETEPAITTVASGGDAVECATTYYAWRKIFARLLEIDRSKSDDEIRAHILSRLPAPMRPMGAMLNCVLQTALPETAASSQLEGSARAAATPRFLAQAFQALAGAGPTLLVVEDAQWLDSASWALLESVHRTARALMIVVAVRPLDAAHEVLARLRDGEAAHLVSLHAMTPADVTAIVAARLGVEHVPDALALLIREKAEGNPFFAEELTSALRDAGVIRVEQGVCHIDGGLQQMTFPDTIEGVVTSRIDRLTPFQQLGLKVASVLGRAFSYPLMLDVFPKQHPGHDLVGMLDGLSRLDLARTGGAGESQSDVTYSFRHAVTQDVAYNLMLFEQRRSLHEGVADWYERVHGEELAPYYGLLAHHRRMAIEGVSTPDEARVVKAIEALARAGNQSLATGATTEAKHQLGAGLRLIEMLPPSPARSRLELDLRSSMGTSFQITHGAGSEDVRREFARARELCQELGERGRLFEAMFGIWLSHLSADGAEGALSFSQQLLDVAHEASDPSFLHLAHQARGATLLFAAELPTALAHFDQGLAFANAIPSAHGDQGALARTRNPLAMTYAYASLGHAVMGNPDRAREASATAIRLAKKIAHPLTLAQVLMMSTLVWRYQREPDGAEEVMREGLALATEHHLSYWIAQAAATRGWLALERGDTEAGIVDVQRAFDQARAMGVVPLMVGLLYTDLMEGYLRLGRLDEAFATLKDARATMTGPLFGFGTAEIWRLEGELWQRRGGEDERAETCFRTALDLSRQQGARTFELRAAMSLHKLWRGQKSPTRIARLLASVYGSFTEGHGTRDLADAKTLLDTSEPEERWT